MQENNPPSQDYITYICELFGDTYDDREEDSSPKGRDWVPGKKSNHTSLSAFQKCLEKFSIRLSTGKIRKILITGGVWTTERSRKIAELYSEFLIRELKLIS